jgi:toxin FitB
MTLNYLLDTCVVSEFTKPGPNQKVLSWLNSTDVERQFISSVSLGEIQKGISSQQNSNRRAELEEWFRTELMNQFSGRILSLDVYEFIVWGQMTARQRAQGKTMPVIDSLIAAIALCHQMTLVTRNVTDFLETDLSIINPWE